MLKACKFGGSSVAGAEQFRKVRDIVLSDASRRVVVISAAGKRTSDDHKLTDLLYLCHAHLTYGVSCAEILAAIRSRFVSIRDELGLSYRVEDEFDAYAATLSRDTSVDELVSRGEYFTARLMAETLGYAFVDAADCVFFGFDGQFDRARTDAAIAAALEKSGKIVLPGFYGRVPTGKIKVMTRGGSDITGALAAAALDADVYENWTDVSGFLMADPRIVKDPLPIERITYSELRELSYIGAQVLHEGTIFPVREKNIPLNIRNTNQPDHPGTMIRESFDEPEEKADSSFITGIAGRKDFSVITITKNGMSNEAGVLRRVLEILEKYQLVVEYLPSGIDSVSLVVAADKLRPCQYQILGEIQKALKPDTIHVTEDMAIVAAVGRKMAFKPGISGKIFAALGENGINIRMITQGPEELNIIVGVDNKDFAGAIRVLYDSFVK